MQVPSHLLSPTVGEFLSRIHDVRDVLGPIAALPGVLFFAKDADYRYVMMSPGIRQSIGLTTEADESVGRTDFDFFPPLIAASYRENDRKVIERGKTLLDEVHVGITRQGRAQLTYSSKWPIRDRAGRIVGLVGTNRPHESTVGETAGDEAAQVLPAVSLMFRDFARRLSVGNLAATCGLSPSHFMRMFRQRMGVTAHQFLESVRITEAGRMLRTSSRPIAEVATACGFYDHSAFIKRFRRSTGLAPLAYRKSRHSILSTDLSHASTAANTILGSHDDERRDGHRTAEVLPPD